MFGNPAAWEPLEGTVVAGHTVVHTAPVAAAAAADTAVMGRSMRRAASRRVTTDLDMGFASPTLCVMKASGLVETDHGLLSG